MVIAEFLQWYPSALKRVAFNFIKVVCTGSSQVLLGNNGLITNQLEMCLYDGNKCGAGYVA